MNNKYVLELIWILATVVIAVLVLLPIYHAIGDKYTYYTENIVFIVIFVTFTRWMFLLKYTPFAWSKKIKAALIFLPILLFFYCMDAMYDFQAVMDETGFEFMFEGLSQSRYMSLLKYTKYQYLFFGTGALICIFALPVRMINSLWRQINKNRV